MLPYDDCEPYVQHLLTEHRRLHTMLERMRTATGNHVSHANNRRKRRWMPNLQTVRVLVEGKPKRTRVCTRCIRSNRVTKAA